MKNCFQQMFSFPFLGLISLQIYKYNPDMEEVNRKRKRETDKKRNKIVLKK